MKRRSLITKIALAAGLALVAGACSAAAGSPRPGAGRPPLPQGAPVVTVGMKEYAFDYDGNVPAGRVVFRIRNTGVEVHRLTLVPLAESFPPILEQLRGTERRIIDPFAGIYDRQPGSGGTFAVDLEKGRRYAIVCFTIGEDNVSHAVKGMASEFRAGEGAGR